MASRSGLQESKIIGSAIGFAARLGGKTEMRQDSGRSGRAVPCARLPPQKCLKVVKTNVGNSGAKAALSCVVALGFVFAQARVQIASAAQPPKADSRKISASDWSLSVLQPAAVDGKELPPAFAKTVPSS